MPSKEARKEAIKKFKDRKVRLGVYAIRCTATGRAWVGASRNLDATKNGAWFGLRLGGYIDKSLQAEWNKYGEPAFEYEILETLDDDLEPLAIPDLLKQKRVHWIAQTDARGLY